MFFLFYDDLYKTMLLITIRKNGVDNMVKMLIAQTLVTKNNNLKDDKERIERSIAIADFLSEQTKQVHHALINLLSEKVKIDEIKEDDEFVIAEFILGFEINLDKYNKKEDEYITYTEFFDNPEMFNNLLSASLEVGSMINIKENLNVNIFENYLNLLRFSVFTDISNVLKDKKGVILKII